MNTTLLPAIVIPAMVNMFATVGMIAAYRRWQKYSLLLIPIVPVFASAAIMAGSESPDWRFSFMSTVPIMICATSIVWLPAAVDAVLAAQSQGRARVIGSVVSALVGAGLGGSLLFVGLAISCPLGGECL